MKTNYVRDTFTIEIERQRQTRWKRTSVMLCLCCQFAYLVNKTKRCKLQFGRFAPDTFTIDIEHDKNELV